MAHRLLFTFVLVTVLSSVISFSSIDYAYSKESKSGQDGEVKSAQSSDDSSSHKDSDKNKIVDALDEEIKSQSDDYEKNIIALLKVPNQETADKVNLFKKIFGEFQTLDTYSIIPGFAAKMSKKQILALAALSDTIQIEPDLEVNAFLDDATLWFGAQQAKTEFSVDGNADGSPATYSKDDVVIAIIDTGICANHLDLDSGKVIGWKDLVNNAATPYDDNGHGCHVASIAAGEGQANPAYTGVAPRAALVGVKVLNSAGSGFTSTVISGVDWVYQNKALYGIKVMNLSLGSSGCSDGSDGLSLTINNAVNNGIVAVVAAGNSGPKTCTIGSPGAAANAITVAAMADPGQNGFALASFSSRGPTLDNRIKPDVVAPGVSITAAKSGTTTGYTTLSGTSMATPFVAGVAALMLDANPSLTPADVKSKIMGTAIDWGPAGSEVDHGSGRLDAYEAVRNAFAAPPLGSNIAVPTHSFISDNLGGTGATDNWSINVVDTSYPVAIAMIMTAWSSSSSPDFDMKLFSPGASLIASSEGTSRQETIQVPVSATGTYTLQVYSYTGSGPYFVDISAGTTPPIPNDPPIAVDDSGATDEDTAVTINVVTNDNDPNLDALTVTSISTPSNGSVVNNGGGTVKYTPNTNFNGADGFSYTISDGKGGTDTASVSVTVNAINDVPVANGQSVMTVEDTAVTITLTGSDGDGDPLTFSIVVQPADATPLTITPVGSNSASVTYTPNLNFVGSDIFTFKVNDGSLDSNIATVNITVKPTQVFFDNFASQGAFAKWTETNEFDWRVKSPAEKQIPGYASSNLVAHAHSCTSSAGCIITMTNSIDLSGYQGVTLKFWRYVDNNLDNGEFLRVQAFDGVNWNTIFSWTNGQGDDDIWHQESLELQAGYLVNNFNLRFVSKESGSSEEVEIDDVSITGIEI